MSHITRNHGAIAAHDARGRMGTAQMEEVVRPARDSPPIPARLGGTEGSSAAVRQRAAPREAETGALEQRRESEPGRTNRNACSLYTGAGVSYALNGVCPTRNPYRLDSVPTPAKA